MNAVGVFETRPIRRDLTIILVLVLALGPCWKLRGSCCCELKGSLSDCCLSSTESDQNLHGGCCSVSAGTPSSNPDRSPRCCSDRRSCCGDWLIQPARDGSVDSQCKRTCGCSHDPFANLALAASGLEIRAKLFLDRPWGEIHWKGPKWLCHGQPTSELLVEAKYPVRSALFTCALLSRWNC